MDFNFHTSFLRVGLPATVCTAAFAIAFEAQCTWGMAVAAIGWITVFVLHYRTLRNSTRKLDLIFKASRNGDYAFRLPEHGTSRTSSTGINRIMEHYSQIIQEDRRRIHENALFHEQILANVNTGVLVTEEDGNIYSTNPAALRLLGLPALNRVQQLEHYGREAADFFRSATQGEQRQFHLHIQDADRELLVHSSVMNIGGRTMRIFTLDDVRTAMDRNELEAWVKLSRVLTHEIMNAVTPVASLAESMMAQPDMSAERLHEGLQTIRSTSQGLISFVENYRKFTSLPTPQPTLFYVRELTEEIRTLKMEPEHIRLAVSVSPEDLLLHADKHLIRQVLINLVRNAIQAIGETEGRIVLQAFGTDDGHVHIRVSNDGPVINETDRAHLFVPFFTTKPHGNGIGLSVSRQIMSLSHGTITLLPACTRGWNTTFELEFD